jgi:hypothetical protein
MLSRIRVIINDASGSRCESAFWLFLAFKFLEAGVILIAFAAGGFDVEHQILHVEPQLAEGVLDKLQDPAAAFGAFDHAFERGDQVAGILVGKSVDRRGEAEQVRRQLFDRGRGNSWCVRHGCFSGWVLPMPKCTRCAASAAGLYSLQA